MCRFYHFRLLFFSSRRRHTRCSRDWSSDVCSSDLWRLLIRGALLLMVTLGIYRFWLATDVRRFLWSNTEIAGETLEYTGTPLELLLGFLIAIAILIPVYIGFFLAALDLGFIGQMSGIAAFA